LRKLFETGSTAGIQASHAKRLRMQLAALDTAQAIDDMDLPSFELHPLKGEMHGRWAISVNGTATDVRVPGWERLQPEL